MYDPLIPLSARPVNCVYLNYSFSDHVKIVVPIYTFHINPHKYSKARAISGNIHTYTPPPPPPPHT